jgi:hypothetical protein
MSTCKLWLAVLIETTVCAGANLSGEVHIFVRGSQHVDLLVVHGAQQRASEMLRSAGIQIVWKIGRLDHAACCNPQLVLEYGTDHSRAPDVMAYAFPYGNGSRGIKILYHRIVAKRRRPEKVLAHVIVHEVTHMLQGFARHSDSGIMKAHWGPEDYQQIEQSPLAFTAEDINLIQLGVAKRIAALSVDKGPGYNSPVQQVTRP